jgi:hypothetical protein
MAQQSWLALPEFPTVTSGGRNKSACVIACLHHLRIPFGLTPVTGTLKPSKMIISLTMTRVAGSLVLSLLNLSIVAVALAVGYSGLSPWWAAVVLWTVPLPLVLLTMGYIIADAVKSTTRKQALVALAVFIPTAAVEWYFRFRGI